MIITDRQQHLKQVIELLDTFTDPCDELIYHYTTAEGFQGIIETSEIWMTNTEFVNDTTECKALRNEKYLFKKEELSFNRYLEKRWENFLNKKDETHNYYIASFSKASNLLEQWRSYGNICIGFDAKQIKKTGFNLYECVYDKKKIKKWILEKAKIKEWMLDEPDRDFDGRDMAASALLHCASNKLKHNSYHNEKEVRLLAASNHSWGFYSNSPSMYEKESSIYFRTHAAFKLPVPYIKFFISAMPEEEEVSIKNYNGKTELQIKEEKREKENKQKRALLPIQEVWVGPSLHQEETRLACEILLHEKGYKKVSILVSELPYRGC